MSTLKDILILGALPETVIRATERLRKQGVSIRQVEGPYRLVAAFASQPADVVVLDILDLRQKDLEIVKVVREMQPDVGIVVLTDRDQRELAGNALCGGADLYLLKPTTGPEFLAALERAQMRRRVSETSAEETAAPSQALYTLARGVAHEINNPLTTISGWLQVLAVDHAQNEQLAGVLSSMKEEVDRIAEVVRQLLAFAQNGPPADGEVVLPDILEELRRNFEPIVVEKGATLDMNAPAELPTVRGDAAQLRQAFDTILQGAVEGLSAGNRITVSARAERGGVRLVFHDDGPAIPPDALERIFDPFHDGRRGVTTGMGLSLAQGIVRGHGGKIAAASSPQEGTRFAVWLPARTKHGSDNGGQGENSNR